MEDLVTSDLTMFSLIVGFVAPIIIALVQQPTWSPRLKALVTALFCIIVGALTAYFTGYFTGSNIVTSILIVFVMAIATYQNFWKKTGVAPAIETKTSPQVS